MGAIFLIIAIVALVSLYDHFSANRMHVRSEVVFEKRNKDYGAYVMRKGYDRNFLLILCGTTVGISVLLVVLTAFRGAPKFVLHKSEPHTTICGGGSVVFVDVFPEGDKSTHLPRPMNFMAPRIVDFDIDYLDSYDPESEIGDRDQIQKPEPEKVVQPLEQVKVDTSSWCTPPWEHDPGYNGGMNKLREFLQKNLVYPERAKQEGIEGKCWMRFKVDKSGKISGVRVMRGVKDCPECGEECIRVIEKMPAWKPGRTRGEAVDSFYDLPIRFVLE